MKMSVFKYGDRSIFYEEYGTGKPLVFLHGNTASSKMFELLMPLYAENFRCILILKCLNSLCRCMQKISGAF